MSWTEKNLPIRFKFHLYNTLFTLLLTLLNNKYRRALLAEWLYVEIFLLGSTFTSQITPKSLNFIYPTWWFTSLSLILFTLNPRHLNCMTCHIARSLIFISNSKPLLMHIFAKLLFMVLDLTKSEKKVFPELLSTKLYQLQEAHFEVLTCILSVSKPKTKAN